MKIFSHLSVALIFLLIQSIFTLYSISPVNMINIMDPASIIVKPIIMLSPQGDKFIVSFLNLTGSNLQYKILTLDGQQQCKKQHDSSARYLLAWPPQSGPIFLANDNVTINRYKSECNQLEEFTRLQTKPDSMTTFVKDNDPFVSIAFKGYNGRQRIRDYNIRTYNVTEKLDGQSYYTFTIKSFIPSEDGKWLYVGGSFSNDTSENKTLIDQIIVFSEYSKQFDINTTLQPRKVIEQGFYCLGIIDKTLLRINIQNVTKTIRELQTNQVEAGICTKDNLFVTVKFTNLVQKIELFIYSTDDGSQVQNIQLDFIPVTISNQFATPKYVQCNDDSLLLLGVDGTVRIFKYTPSNVFPVWAIILICVGALIIVLVVVICVIKRKKKKSKSQKQIGKYTTLLD